MPAIELKIVVDEAGRCMVTGPIDNTLLCYGLLETAKDTIRHHQQSQAARLVQPASMLPPTPVLHS